MHVAPQVAQSEATIKDIELAACLALGRTTMGGASDVANG